MWARHVLRGGLNGGPRHFTFTRNCDCLRICFFTTMNSMKDDVTLKSLWIYNSFQWLLKVPEFSMLVRKWQGGVVILWVTDIILPLRYFTLQDRVETIQAPTLKVPCVLPTECLYVSINKYYRKFSPSAKKIIYGIQEKELTENSG
jgi:hypothetical protein